MIELERVSFAYGGRTALADLSFRVRPGERVVVLGANGSGKSTLLKLLDGLLFPQAGVYRYRGEPVTAARLRDRAFRRRFRREVAFLFQNPEVMLFHPTVFDDIAFGPRQLGWSDVEDRVRFWARRCGVEAYLEDPPFRLSAGQRKRVALACLLILEPRLLLLDEPAAGLDPRSVGWLVELLAGLDVTLLAATHNLSLAPELGERALLLGEDHTLLYDGALDPLLDDADRLLAANLIHVHRHRHGPLEHRHPHGHDWS